MKDKNPYKGDTLWGDFKDSALGSMIIGLGKLLVVLGYISVVGILLYFSTKAMVLLIRRILFGKPLPDFEEFPRTWYLFGAILWLVLIPIIVLEANDVPTPARGCLYVEPPNGYRKSDMTPPHYHR